MIILRQKQFNTLDENSYISFYDEDGNLKPFKEADDEFRYNMIKKKLEKMKDSEDEEERRTYERYREFVKNGNKKKESSGGRDKAVDDYHKSNSRAKGITWGTWGASIGNAMIRKKIKNNRSEEVDEKIGHDKRMKRSDRAEINQLKSKSSKTKKALQDAIDENKTDEERKKAAKKYIRREALDRASDMAVGGANAGANLGYVGGYMNTLNKLAQDRLTASDRSLMKGTLGGMAGGAALGATIGGIRAARASKKTIERLRNSQDKKKAKDKVKVARGEMTESEFVERHGGK